MNMKKQIIADIILLGVTFVWGTTFLLVQKAIDALPPYSFLFVRFALASVFLLIILLWQQYNSPNKHTLKLSRSTWLAGSVLALWLFVGYAFQTIGLIYTTSSKAGFITGLSVVLVPIFTFLVLRIRPKIPAIIGVVLASFGLFFLAFGDQISTGTITETLNVNTGDLLVFFCTIGFAMQIVYTGKYASHHNVLLLTVLELGIVALLSLVFALFTEDLTPLLSLSTYAHPMVIVALIVTAFFGTALAFLAQTHFQKYTTPTRVALIFAMEPIFAALTGVVFGGEVLTLIMIIGCALIFIGMICAELPMEVFYKIFRINKQMKSKVE